MTVRQAAGHLKEFIRRATLFILSVFLVLYSAGPRVTHAATTPSLGAAASYGVLASTYTNTSVSTVNGDVGFTTPPAVAPLGTHTNYGSGPPYATAGTDQAAALTDLNGQACTTNFPPGAVVITGTYTPGVYCSTGAMNLSGTITLNGAGTYIFRADGALDTAAGTVVTLAGGASACDVFWTPTAATTIGANTTFVGTVIDDAAITVGANTTWLGRALSFASTVTTDTTTITVPSCAPAPATINVVKTVINDSGRTKVISDFPLFVSGTPVTSGATNTFAPGAYVITETTDPDYVQTFSGDCDATGNLSIVPGDNKFCIITNNDIAAPVVPPVPPLISVVKVPNPLTLPSGPGSVTYTFTLRNLGTVTATNISMVDDSCSPLVLISGDTNANTELEINETWTYTCTTTLSQTHTNNLVVTGQANGITATDIASATVVVGSAVVPPLIHVTKVPNPLTLLAGGGMVIYTLNVTNPGTVPLTNVSLTDNTCAPLTFISGDTNSNSQLDTTETWAYTCTAHLTQTTVNIAIASGEANGLTARDFAITTVVVGTVPGLPNTGNNPAY